MALERLRDNIEQRDDMLMERMQQEAGASVERVEEETMKLQDAEGTFEERREEWRKMLVCGGGDLFPSRALDSSYLCFDARPHRPALFTPPPPPPPRSLHTPCESNRTKTGIVFAPCVSLSLVDVQQPSRGRARASAGRRGLEARDEAAAG